MRGLSIEGPLVQPTQCFLSKLYYCIWRSSIFEAFWYWSIFWFTDGAGEDALCVSIWRGQWSDIQEVCHWNCAWQSDSDKWQSLNSPPSRRRKTAMHTSNSPIQLPSAHVSFTHGRAQRYNNCRIINQHKIELLYKWNVARLTAIRSPCIEPNSLLTWHSAKHTSWYLQIIKNIKCLLKQILSFAPQQKNRRSVVSCISLTFLSV